MSSLVLDASIVIGWSLADESDKDLSFVDAQLPIQSILVPQIWHIELRSALLSADRRKRITSDQVDELLQYLALIPVSTDSSPRLDIALTVARKHRLSLYDAVYLELALRSGCGLATRDKKLTKAALAENCLFVNP